jgi:hypothetical protein
VSKTSGGLEFTLRPSPGEDGAIKRWSAKSGQVYFTSGRLEFAPKPGTTMADFSAGDPPTDNEEFFNALKRAAPGDWRAMARALQWAVVRSAPDDGAIVLAPCSGGSRLCMSEHAFAAYAKASKTFYFAYEALGGPPAEVHYYPARETWPTDVSEIVARWANGEMREPR